MFVFFTFVTSLSVQLIEVRFLPLTIILNVQWIKFGHDE